MFWLGFTIGIAIGAALVTLGYTALVDRIETAEFVMRRHVERVTDLQEQLDRSELKYRELSSDFKVLQAMAPKEIVQRFFDAPYRN